MSAGEHSSLQQFRQRQLHAMDPDTRALALAQENVHYWHSRLTMPLPGEHEASLTPAALTGEAGHPRAEEAYVTMHRDPEAIIEYRPGPRRRACGRPPSAATGLRHARARDSAPDARPGNRPPCQ